MWIYEFKDYKAFLKRLIKTFPKNGRGQAQRLSEYLGTTSMVISHILTRDRHFSLEQAIKVSEFFGLDEESKNYFLLLVQFERAGTKDLKNFFEEKINNKRTEAQKIKNMVRGEEKLSPEDMGVFYSNWYFSGVRLLASIEGYQTIESIADYFGLSRTKTGEIVSFLVKKGLCIQEDGKVRMGPKSTHVSDKSEFVNNHRRNWREKAREKFNEVGPHDFFYSSPVSISKKDSLEFRKKLLDLIKSFSKQVEDSPEEILVCLNIDWFEF